MRKMLHLTVATLLVAFAATAAVAQIDVELAFDPDVAHPGDTVMLFTSIANLGDEDVVADIEVSIEVMGEIFGPFGGSLPLAAGEELSREFAFIIPPLEESGDLTITVTATAGEWSDTASATLTVVVDGGMTANPDDIADIGTDLVKHLGGSAATDTQLSLGELKHLYR